MTSRYSCRIMHLASLTLHPERFPMRNCYPFSLPHLQQLGTLAFDTPVTFFVGENGSGKSTLLEAIAVRCGIHIWRDESPLRVEHNRWERRLAEFLEVAWTDGPVPGSFFGADIFRNFAQMLDKWAANDPGLLEYFGGHSLLTLSHGQSLLAYFRSRYRIKGLYLLDEPETALSPRSQLELLRHPGARGRGGPRPVHRRDPLADPARLPGRSDLELRRDAAAPGRIRADGVGALVPRVPRGP